MKRLVVLSVVLAAIVAIGAIGLYAQGRWELLGQRNVRDRVDHDRIAVTRAKGTFKSVMLEVRRRGVDFQQVVIHFANGEDQRVELRASIPAGGQTRVIDVEGRDRVIRSVEFWYDAKSLGRGGTATVRLLGRN